jgi:transposase-like protein
MGLSRWQFTEEFKLAAIQRLEMAASVAEVARAFEVNLSSRRKRSPVATASHRSNIPGTREPFLYA